MSREISRINITLRRMNGRLQANQLNDSYYRSRIRKDIRTLYGCVGLLCAGLLVVALRLWGAI